MSLELQKKHRIFGLDIVRALAILFVVFSHLHYLIDSHNPLLMSVSGLFGFFGVEIFFVLSGFLIGTILLKMFLKPTFTQKDVLNFLKRRWFRTLPNYYLVLILNLILAFLFGYAAENWWKYFFFIQNFNENSISFFVESWSLSIEEWTYILSPIVLFFGWKLFHKNKKAGFIIITLFMIVFFHALRYFKYLNATITDMTIWNSDVKAIVMYRIDSILFGFVVAWLCMFCEKWMKKYRVYFFIVAIHLFLFQFVVMNVLGFDLISSPLYYNVFYFSLTSFTIALGLPLFVFWEKGNLLVKPITFISKTSYSVYLLHYSIISFLLKEFLNHYNVLLNPLFLIVLYLGITFFCSYILYVFYEKPIMKWRDK